MTKRPYAGVWPRIRLTILDRDGYRCMINGPKCKKVATTVDHIVPILAGGSWYDPDNLRAACEPCNYGRAGQTGSRRWQTAITYITLVVGEGASQYVKTHSQPNDLIVDDEQIRRSVNDEHTVALVRERILNQLRAGKIQNPRAWITAPAASSVYPHHRLIDLGTKGAGTQDRSAIDRTRTDSEGAPSNEYELVHAW